MNNFISVIRGKVQPFPDSRGKVQPFPDSRGNGNEFPLMLNEIRVARKKPNTTRLLRKY